MMYVMKDGQIVEAGLVKELFDDPKHPYTIKLLNSIRAKRKTKY